MKLSMYILEKWYLEHGYKLQSAIEKGECCLVGARISNDNSKRSLACISVENAEYGLVTVHNNEDIIFVINSKGEEILNITNEAFEYYNAWEASLLRGAFGGTMLQDLLNEAHLAIRRPMIIKNCRRELCAITDSYGPQVHPLWADYLSTPIPSKLGDYYGRDFNELKDIAAKRTPDIAWSPTYKGEFMYANIIVNDRRVGYITAYENGRPFGKCDLQLMQVFQEIVSFYISADPSVLFQQPILEEYMLSSLDHTPFHYGVCDVYRDEDWDEGDELAVIVTRDYLEMTKERAIYIKERLESLLEYSCIVARKEEIIALVNVSKKGTYDELMEAIEGFAEENKVLCGISVKFTELEQFSRQYAMAGIACGCAEQIKSSSMSFHRAKLAILAGEMRKLENIDMLKGRDYVLLKNYDDENGTQLAETFFWYLIYNYKLMDVAEQMKVHRNTIDYRVNKIFEIINEEVYQIVANRIMYVLTYCIEDLQTVYKK